MCPQPFFVRRGPSLLWLTLRLYPRARLARRGHPAGQENLRARRRAARVLAGPGRPPWRPPAPRPPRAQRQRRTREMRGARARLVLTFVVYAPRSFSHLRFKLEYATHTTSHHHQPRLREMRCVRAAHCNPGHTGAQIHQRSVRLHDAQEPCVQGHARQGRRRNAARVPGRLGALSRAARSPSVARH